MQTNKTPSYTYTVLESVGFFTEDGDPPVGSIVSFKLATSDGKQFREIGNLRDFKREGKDRATCICAIKYFDRSVIPSKLCSAEITVRLNSDGETIDGTAESPVALHHHAI